MNSNIQSLHSNTLLKYLRQSGLTDPQVDGLESRIVLIEEIMADYRVAVDHIKNSGGYTPEGQIPRLAKAAEEALERLQQIDVTGYDNHAKQLEDDLRPTDPKVNDPLLQYHREAEVRARLSELPELELQILYLEKCRDGGVNADVVIGAITNDPLPRLTAEILEEGRTALAERQNPEKAQLLSAIYQLRKGFQDAMHEAERELIDGGLPQDDFLMQIASGKIS